VAEENDLSNDPGGRTALHLAIVHKHTKVIDVLLQHKGESIARLYVLQSE
jgi:ankyrin repeat protein